MGLGFFGWAFRLGGASGGRRTAGGISSACFSSTAAFLSISESASFCSPISGADPANSSNGLPRSCVAAAAISLAGITSPSMPGGGSFSGSVRLLLGRTLERNSGLVCGRLRSRTVGSGTGRRSGPRPALANCSCSFLDCRSSSRARRSRAFSWADKSFSALAGSPSQDPRSHTPS